MSIQSTYPVHTLSDGATIPGVAYGGTAWYGRGGVNRELVDAVKTALSVGFTHLDNAEAYANEESVGVAIQESGIPRESLFITTKVGPGMRDIRATCLASLKKLQLEYIDLYLLHWPYDFGKEGYPSNEQAWKVLEQLKDEGLVKSIGVSNYRIIDLEKTLGIAKHRPVVNQIEFHPFVYASIDSLVEYMKKEGIKLEAYAPSAPITKFAGGPFDAVLAKVTEAVSSRAGKKVEPSQVLLHAASQLGAIVITTSGKDWRMKEQLLADSLPALTDDEVAELKSAGTPHQRVFMHHMDTTTPY